MNAEHAPKWKKGSTAFFDAITFHTVLFCFSKHLWVVLRSFGLTFSSVMTTAVAILTCVDPAFLLGHTLRVWGWFPPLIMSHTKPGLFLEVSKGKTNLSWRLLIKLFKVFESSDWHSLIFFNVQYRSLVCCWCGPKCHSFCSFSSQKVLIHSIQCVCMSSGPAPTIWWFCWFDMN